MSAVGQENKLGRNFSLMFWLEALTEVKMINVVTAIFLVYRGLTLSQIFYTSAIFSVITVLTELPSSYLADRWSRKKVVVLSAIFNLITWVVFVYAHSFAAFAAAFGMMAISDALMSGTDEAIIFDTSKALGVKKESLGRLGVYFSAKRMFKIVTPILAAIIAHNLADIQFVYLLLIDIAAGVGALLLSFFLAEPSHYLELEKAEVGVFRDAVAMFKTQPKLVVAMMNRTLFFIANFAIWRISSQMFNSVGVSILLIGITNSFYQLVLFILNRSANKIWTKIAVEERIDRFSSLVFISILLLLVNMVWWKNSYLGLIFFCGVTISESARWPMFSELYNRLSGSYNRATVLSLSNLTNSVIQVPTMLLASIAVGWGYQFLIGWCLVVALIPMIFFRLKAPDADY